MVVSIVTPSFNSASYIEHTVKSIQSQTYPHFEHIVIDAQSADTTCEILRRYPEIRWISERDRGQSDAINKGMAMAGGDILAWQNADDLYFDHTLATVVDFFRANPQVDLLYGNYQLIDEDGKVICDVHPVAWNTWLFAHGRFTPVQPAVFWRRRVYEGIGDLDLNLHYCMDVDFYARVSKQYTIAHLPAMLGKFRVHGESKTQNSANWIKLYREHKSVLSRHYQYNLMDSLIFDFFFLRGNVARAIKLSR